MSDKQDKVFDDLMSMGKDEETTNKTTEEETTEEVVQEQEIDLFVEALKVIRSTVPADKFSEKENKSGYTWFGESRTRLLKIVETKRGLRIEFNVPVSNVEGLTILTEQEAKEKHMGTCRWIYSGDDIETVALLIEEAIEGFEPKKRAGARVDEEVEETTEEAADESEETNEEVEEADVKQAQ